MDKIFSILKKILSWPLKGIWKVLELLRINLLLKKLDNLLNKLSSIRQVQFSFILLLIIFLISGIAVYYTTNLIISEVEEMNETAIRAVRANNQLSADINRHIRNAYNIVGGLSGSIEAGTVDMHLERIEGLADTQEVAEDLDELRAEYDEFIKLVDEIEELPRDERATSRNLRDLDQISRDISITLSRLDTILWERVTAFGVMISNFSTTNRNRVVTLLAISFVLAIILSILISRKMKNACNLIKDKTYLTADKIEEVQLSVNKIEDIARQVRNQIGDAFSALENLTKGNEEISNASDNVSEAIHQVSQGAEGLATQAEEISSAGEETFQAIKSTEIKLEHGNEIVEETTNTMDSLVESINKIESISDKIMQITDQTNLLALNAAIEAARAGEHGQGFSVVAEEIKDLADESMVATKEVQDITEEIKRVTEEAVEKMKEDKGGNESMASIFSDINALFSDVKERMNYVMSYAEDQLASSQEVNAQAEDIAASSQEVSSQTEEAFSLAEDLNGLMKDVKEVTDKLNQEMTTLTEETEEQSQLISQVIENNRKIKK